MGIVLIYGFDKLVIMLDGYNLIPSLPFGLGDLVQKLPWNQIVSNMWKYGLGLWQKTTTRGMYEVLEYESTLDLKDIHGKQASFKKREKVRYLQDSIIAYQDQAWGDGEILCNYQCTPGAPVDFYRPGYKTYIVISLRGVKHRDDQDEFHIQWGIKNGFLRPQELWETEINHLTRQVRVQIIFPKTRPPIHVELIENIRQRSQMLGEESMTRLADGRRMISWGTDRPRLHERYIMQWEW